MRLMLEDSWRQRRVQIGAQKCHAIDLVGMEPEPHPKQMQMVGDQTISWAKEPLTRRGVQHQFPKLCVKDIGKPTSASFSDGKCPVYDCIALIIFTWKTRQIRSSRTIVRRSAIQGHNPPGI